MDILDLRLANQGLVDPAAGTPAEVVRRLGAVQAQDYAGARWAVAQRAPGVTGAAVDDALAAGAILRTHVLRPTWHLVTPADIGWLLELTAPRVRALMAYGNRQSGLDGDTVARSNRALAGALRGGRQLTRTELAAVLRTAGVVPPDLVGLGRIMIAAELDGILCSGALRGKQHTYTLLEERVPSSRTRDRPAALAELAGRYFAGHGPATIKDFAWWSGLSATDATAGAMTARPELHATEALGQTYWSTTARRGTTPRSSPAAHLLPNFDEYTVGYTDRRLLLDLGDEPRAQPDAALILGNVVTVDGRVVGTWKRSSGRDRAASTMTLFGPLGTRADRAVAAARERYAAFTAGDAAAS